MEAPDKKWVCDLCDREFDRPAALGAHRFGAHQIRGSKRKRSKPRQNGDLMSNDLLVKAVEARKQEHIQHLADEYDAILRLVQSV